MHTAAKSYLNMLCASNGRGCAAMDETWYEHKRRYHHGEEPKGDCSWIDNDEGDTSLRDVALRDIINKAKQTAKDVCNDGRWIHQRVPKEALRGVQEGAGLLSEASYVARRAEAPVGVAPRAGVEGERDRLSRMGRAAGAEQERLLEAYARREGIWTQGLDAKLEKKFGEPAEGGESMAFFDAKRGVVEKLITNRMYEQPIENLDRIALHNWLFPETAMKVVGFGRTKTIWNKDDKDGLFVIHVEQPLIQISDSATDDDIGNRMTSMGFSKIPKKRDYESQKWLSGDGAVIVDDLHEENAVYDASGHLCVIDADIRLNTPRLGYGGRYVFPTLSD